MNQFILKAQAGLVVLLVAFNCSLAYGQISLLGTPLFAEQDQAVEIQVSVEDSVESVMLQWGLQDIVGQVEMEPGAEIGYWSAVIPGQDVQGEVLPYTIVVNPNQEPVTERLEGTLYICPEYTVLEPKPMALKAKVLVKNKWNSSAEAFGLSGSDEGPEVGPASIAYDNGTVYVLDSANRRVLGFDKQGKSRRPIAVPAALASDILIDPLDSSVVVVSQLEDKLYRVKKNGTVQSLPLGLNRKLIYPTKFRYDAGLGTLLAEDAVRQNRPRAVGQHGTPETVSAEQTESDPQVLSEAAGNHIRLGFDTDPQVFDVRFDKPIFCIEEALADSNGIIWVLFTLEGDYRVRRLVRVDTSTGLAETAETDVWFSFDATRHMALTEEGVVVFAGDEEEGRIVKFDYDGDIQ